jgi:hypothetical protein
MASSSFKIKFVNPVSFLTKEVPLTIAGVASGNITIRRNNLTGIMDINPYISPVAPNISNTYFFEKNVASVDQDKFVTLIDVFIDTRDYKLPSGMTLAQYEAAGQPNNTSSPSYLEDLHRWKIHKADKVLSRYKGTTIVSLNEFNSITTARMVPWTSSTFACAVVVDPPPVDPSLPPGNNPA